MMDRHISRTRVRRVCSGTSSPPTTPTCTRIRGWSGSDCGRASDVESHRPARRPVMKIRLYGFVLAAAIGAFAAPGWTAPGVDGGGPARPLRRHLVKPARVESDNRTAVFDQARRIDINSINMFVTNYATFANDIENQGNSGLFFPKGTIKTAVYQSGIWLAGKVGNEIRVAIGEYCQEYQTGAMNIGTANPASILAY